VANPLEAAVRFFVEKGMSTDEALRRVQSGASRRSPMPMAAFPGGTPSQPMADAGEAAGRSVSDARAANIRQSMGPEPSFAESEPDILEPWAEMPQSGPGSQSVMPTPPVDDPAPSAAFDPLTADLPRGINKERLAEYRPTIDDAISRHGADPRLVYAILSKENAQLDNTYTSDANAVGLFQVVPSANNTTREEMADPQKNIDFGVKKIAGLQRRYGDDWEKIGAAYFGGEGTVAKPKDKWGPKTREYGAEIASFMGKAGGAQLPEMTFEQRQEWDRMLAERPELRGRPNAARAELDKIMPSKPTESAAATTDTEDSDEKSPMVNWAEKLAKNSADYDKSLRDRYQSYLTDQGKTQAEITAAMDKRDSMIKEYAGAKVDPSRYWKNASIGQNILRMLGATMGALAQGMSMGQLQNSALDTIQREIQRDVDLQLEEIKRLGAAADSQNNLLADLYRKSGDLRQSYLDAQSIMMQSFQTKANAIKDQLALAQGPEKRQLKASEGVELLGELRSVDRIYSTMKEIESVGEWTKLDDALNHVTLGNWRGEDASKIAQLGIEAITKMTELGQGRLSDQDMKIAEKALKGREWDVIRAAVIQLKKSLKRIAGDSMAKTRHLLQSGYEITPEIRDAYSRANDLTDSAKKQRRGEKVK